MGIDFYYLPGSAPCRAVMLTAKAVGVELNLKLTDLMKGEHLTPEFIKLNPQHTVPTLNDNGFCLWESRAICAYLVNKYGKDDSLYPKDPKARALVDQRLYFDLGTLYQRFADYFYPVIFGGASFEPAKKTRMEEGVAFLDKFLDGQTWAAGSNMTIADLSLVASISTLESADVDLSSYSNVMRWYEKVKATAPSYQEANAEGAKAFKALVEHALKK